VAQTIRYFSRESDLPLTIGLLVDTSQSQAHVLEPERQASYVFLDRVLRVEVLQDFTSSRKDLAAALARLKVPTALATLLYDAVRSLSGNQMKPRQGRKAFVLLSDGVDYWSKNNIVTAIEFAQRAGTIIYSILFEEPLKPYRPRVPRFWRRAASVGAGPCGGLRRRPAGATS